VTVAIAAVVLAPAASVAGGTGQRQERLLFVQGARLRTVAPGGGPGKPLGVRTLEPTAPAWSADGTQLAFVANVDGNADLFLAHADGTGVRPIGTTPRAEADPAWAPDGSVLAYVADNRLAILRFTDGARRRLATDGVAIGNPTWSPDGSRIAFSVARADGTAHIYVVPVEGGEAIRVTDGAVMDSDPAWSPGGRFIAFVRRDEAVSPLARLHLMRPDGSELRLFFEDSEPHGDPAWSPRGNRLAFSRGLDAASEIFTIALDGSRLRRLTQNDVPDTDPHWGSVPTRRDLLPDLDQRAPTGLTLTAERGRFKLGFVSATDNVGRGPIWIRGVRASPRKPMEATQLIALASGGVRLIRDAGRIRYTVASSHRHFHLLRFQSYELRRASDFETVAADRKSGFCLADHYGLARARVPVFRPPRFLSNCGQGEPDRLSVEHGTSVGYTDLYPAHFHGQNLDVTALPAGRYWLVHRANPSLRLRELDYMNNSASVLIRLTRPNGGATAPRIHVLRRCESGERC
jgi:Lysyl oxidase/WD40-like Beta Propeller Repeat